MFIVTVNFEIIPRYLSDFAAEMEKQARNSVQTEPDCHQFDVAYATDTPNHCFLYEVYSDRPAFDAHLQSAHFKAFDQAVAGWLKSKTVATFERAWTA